MDLAELVEKAVHTILKGGKPLGKGSHGVAYVVDENVVLKLYSRIDFHNQKSAAEYELEIGSDLHQQGVQVPKYFGLFEPIGSLELSHWGLFRERIYGVKYHTLPELLKLEAKRQYKQQQELIRDLGYIIVDNDVDLNTLFDVERNKLFLHDLVGWGKSPR